jgi:hypothetical protein
MLIGDVLLSQIPAPEESTEEGADSEEGPAVEPLAGPTADDEKLVAASGNAKAASTTLPELLQVSCRHPPMTLVTLSAPC